MAEATYVKENQCRNTQGKEIECSRRKDLPTKILVLFGICILTLNLKGGEIVTHF